jgi:hypothetical protein
MAVSLTLAPAKNIYKISFMGRSLAGEFTVWGIQLQNWMLVAVAIVVLWSLYLWMRDS